MNETPKEDEHNIDFLLKKHEKDINQLKEELKDVLEEQHDEIFLLRYVLSHLKDNDHLKKAAQSIKYTIKYRKENESWLTCAKSMGIEGAPNRELIKKYSCSTIHKTTKDGGPILILRTGLANGSKLMKHISPEEVAKFLVFQDEVAYLQCDKVAREERRLVKLVVINDMRGFSLLSNSKKFFDALGISTKVSEQIYPQLLEKSVAVNPLVIYKVLLSLATLVVSKRSMEKFAYCKGDTSEGDISKCPFASKYLDKENIPTFLGGSCTCKDQQIWGCEGCIDGISNQAKEHPYIKIHKEEKKKKK